MKNEPVMSLATAVAAIWALAIAMFAWYGVDVPKEVQAALVPAVLAAAWLARGLVTPSCRPRDEHGNTLVPEQK